MVNKLLIYNIIILIYFYRLHLDPLLEWYQLPSVTYSFIKPLYARFVLCALLPLTLTCAYSGVRWLILQILLYNIIELV